MGALIIVDNIKDRYWSKFVHEWLITYIKKYLRDNFRNNQMNQTLGGCIYHLAVSYYFFSVVLYRCCVTLHTIKFYIFSEMTMLLTT